MSNSSKFNTTTIIIVIGIIIAAIAGMWVMSRSQPQQIAVEENVMPPTDTAVETGGIELGAAPYSLTATTGETITEKSFSDKYKLVYFGFTRCPDVCPVGMANITAAMGALAADGDKIVPIFITVDPAYDTVQVIKDYLAAFDKHFIGATGTAEQIKAAQDSYRVYAASAEPPKAVEATTEPQTQPAPPKEDHAHGDHDHAGGGDMMNHSDYIYLMGKNGKLINVWPGNTDGQTLSSNIQTALAAELIPTTGGQLPPTPTDANVAAPAATEEGTDTQE